MVGGWLKFLLILRLSQPSLAGVGAGAELGNDVFCQVFHEKTIIISPEDKPWFNEQLRQMKRSSLG